MWRWGSSPDRAWGGVKQIFESIWSGITGTLGNFAGFIRGIFPDVKAAGGELIGAFFDGLRAGMGILGEVISAIGKGIANGIIDVMNAAIGQINDALPNDFGFGPAKIDLPDNPVPTIPRLARGGLVVAGDNPSGIEAIVPLERAHEFGFGGRAVENHFHMSFHGFIGDIDELIRQFDLKLRRSGRSGLLGS